MLSNQVLEGGANIVSSNYVDGLDSQPEMLFTNKIVGLKGYVTKANLMKLSLTF